MVPIASQLSIQNKHIELFNEHHIEGLFYKKFNYAEGLSQYKKQWIHNQTILQVLDDLNTMLLTTKTKATLLKGSHLLLDLYTDIGSRFLSDIDLLISPLEIDIWEKILTEYGCTPILEKKFHANIFKAEWCKKVGEIEINIEIHTKLFFHLKSEKWELLPTPFSNLTKLRDEDLLLHLCGHLAFQHTFLKLYWLFDIYFFYQLKHSTIDWDYLKLKSKSHHLYRSIQMCLWILDQYFAIKMEVGVIELFELNKKFWWKKLLTINFLMYPHHYRFQYLLLKHATKNHLSQAFLYDLSWFYHYQIRGLLLKPTNPIKHIS